MENYEKEDYKRIDCEDFIFGIGVIISEIIWRYLDRSGSSPNDIVNMHQLEENEEADCEEEIKELRVICENEKFTIALTRYYIPINTNTEQYSLLQNNEFVLIKDINYKNDSKEQKKVIIQSIRKLKKILDYFQINNIKTLNYYMYFSERIFINNNGEILCNIKTESEWEHYEIYGEHEH